MNFNNMKNHLYKTLDITLLCATFICLFLFGAITGMTLDGRNYKTVTFELNSELLDDSVKLELKFPVLLDDDKVSFDKQISCFRICGFIAQDESVEGLLSDDPHTDPNDDSNSKFNYAYEAAAKCVWASCPLNNYQLSELKDVVESHDEPRVR